MDIRLSGWSGGGFDLARIFGKHPKIRWSIEWKLLIGMEIPIIAGFGVEAGCLGYCQMKLMSRGIDNVSQSPVVNSQ